MATRVATRSAADAARSGALRIAVAAVVAAIAAGSLLASAWAAIVDARGMAATVDGVIGSAAVGGLGLVAAWVAGAILLAAIAELPGATGRAAARVSAVVTPGAVRRMVALTIGVTVAGGASPALADASPVSGAAADVAGSIGDAGGLGGMGGARTTWNGPDGPDGTTSNDPDGSRTTSSGSDVVVASGAVETTSVHASAPMVDRPDLPSLDRPADAATVVVRPGDSLWAIVGRHLGPDATDGAIATEWPRWYAANRAVIGADPDLIHPGQRLAPPP